MPRRRTSWRAVTALVQRGTFGDTKFGYFETADDPGTLTEIVYLDANMQRHVRQHKSANILGGGYGAKSPRSASPRLGQRHDRVECCS